MPDIENIQYELEEKFNNRLPTPQEELQHLREQAEKAYTTFVESDEALKLLNLPISERFEAIYQDVEARTDEYRTIDTLTLGLLLHLPYENLICGDGYPWCTEVIARVVSAQELESSYELEDVLATVASRPVAEGLNRLYGAYDSGKCLDWSDLSDEEKELLANAYPLAHAKEDDSGENEFFHTCHVSGEGNKMLSFGVGFHGFEWHVERGPYDFRNEAVPELDPKLYHAEFWEDLTSEPSRETVKAKAQKHYSAAPKSLSTGSGDCDSKPIGSYLEAKRNDTTVCQLDSPPFENVFNDFYFTKSTQGSKTNYTSAQHESGPIKVTVSSDGEHIDYQGFRWEFVTLILPRWEPGHLNLQPASADYGYFKGMPAHFHADVPVGTRNLHLDMYAVGYFGPGSSLCEIQVYESGLLVGRGGRGHVMHCQIGRDIPIVVKIDTYLLVISGLKLVEYPKIFEAEISLWKRVCAG